MIICEKPRPVPPSRARELIVACKKPGCGLLVAHVVRFFPEYALAQASRRAGADWQAGVVRLTRGSFRPKKPAETGSWTKNRAASDGLDDP